MTLMWIGMGNAQLSRVPSVLEGIGMGKATAPVQQSAFRETTKYCIRRLTIEIGPEKCTDTGSAPR